MLVPSRIAGSLYTGLLGIPLLRSSSRTACSSPGVIAGERNDDGVPSRDALSAVAARRGDGRLGVVGGSVVEMVGIGRGSVPGRGVTASLSEWDGGGGSGTVGGGAGSGGAGLRDMRRAWL